MYSVFFFFLPFGILFAAYWISKENWLLWGLIMTSFFLLFVTNLLMFLSLCSILCTSNMTKKNYTKTKVLKQETDDWYSSNTLTDTRLLFTTYHKILHNNSSRVNKQTYTFFSKQISSLLHCLEPHVINADMHDENN